MYMVSWNREVGFVQDSGTFHFDIILSRITLCFHLFSFVPILCLHAGSLCGLYFHLSAFQLIPVSCTKKRSPSGSATWSISFFPISCLRAFYNWICNRMVKQFQPHTTIQRRHHLKRSLLDFRFAIINYNHSNGETPNLFNNVT